MIDQLKKEFDYFILLISSWSLFFAFIVEYIFISKPCVLCVYQRFPYLLLIYLSIITLSSKRNILINYSYLLLIITSILLAGYHTGVEEGIFTLSKFCKPLFHLNTDISVESFKKMLDIDSTPKCDKAEMLILGLSLAKWNLLLNLFLLITIVRINFFRRIRTNA